jgi:hypothetical protein
MNYKNIKYGIALPISRNKFLFHNHIHYLPAKEQTIIENAPLFDMFLPQNIKIYSLLGQNEFKNEAWE